MTVASGAALALAGASIMLGSCQRDIDVAVTSTRGVVAFEVPATKPPCVNRVTVYAARDRANPVWLIDSDDRSRCVTSFRYAEVPAGFTQRGGVESLKSGDLYLVAVARPGASGITFFQPGGEGSIVREAPTD